MYEERRGITGRPFQPTLDPRFLFETAGQRKAMAYLGYALAQREGLVVVTGDIGVGKTTLIDQLLATIDQDGAHVVRLASSAIGPADLLRSVATQLGVGPAGLDKARLLPAIERGLHAVARSGRRTLVTIDEAQVLPLASLEELCMLSDLQAGGHALTQIVLVGRPEFRARLEREGALEQLRRRVIAVHHMHERNEEEIPPEQVASRPFPVRPDLVEGRPTLASEGRPSTSSGRTEEEKPVPSRPHDTRLAELEARLLEQDAALRRVLQMMVEEVEADPPVATRRDRAA